MFDHTSAVAPRPPASTAPAAREPVGVDYLAALAARVTPIKVRSHAAMGLSPGDVALDVGCGHGFDILALAARVGATGRVVGIDHDPGMIAAARRAVNGAAAPVELHRADATALPLADDAVDACRSERVFQHLADGRAALAEMVRVTRPGGRVVLLDTDWGSISIDGPDTRVERRIARYTADRCLADGYAGRRLYGMARRAGLLDVTVEGFCLVLDDFALVRALGPFDLACAEAVAAGVVTPAEVDDWRAGLAALDTAGQFCASVNLVLVCGQVPGAEGGAR